MTPAEFDTRRRSLGLSVDETAALCGVQDRTVRRWQTGQNPIPASAIDQINALEEAMDEAVERATTQATEFLAGGECVLYRYRTPADLARSPHAGGMPLGAHAMLIAWTADALEAEGIKAVIEWAE